MREVHFRDGIPGEQVASVVDATRLEWVQTAFRRSATVKPTEADRKRLW